MYLQFRKNIIYSFRLFWVWLGALRATQIFFKLVIVARLQKSKDLSLNRLQGFLNANFSYLLK